MFCRLFELLLGQERSIDEGWVTYGLSRIVEYSMMGLHISFL